MPNLEKTSVNKIFTFLSIINLKFVEMRSVKRNFNNYYIKTKNIFISCHLLYPILSFCIIKK